MSTKPLADQADDLDSAVRDLEALHEAARAFCEALTECPRATMGMVLTRRAIMIDDDACGLRDAAAFRLEEARAVAAELRRRADAEGT